MPAAERVLTERQLNRALLARQLLLERGRMSIPKALERVGGIQAQYAPSTYVGLWTRLEGFDRDHLTRALERRSVVQGTLMRVTIHAVSAPDYWPLTAALREARRRWLLRTRKPAGGEREMEAAARRLRAAIGNGVMTLTEIRALLGDAASQPAAWWLDMVRVPPAGTWERRRADIYALAEHWLDGGDELDRAEALDHTVRMYLRGFGPASRRDIASWGGLPVSEVAPALERMDLRRFRDEAGRELLDLPRAPLPDPDTPAPVRLLPVWDAMLLVHARRTGILPEYHRPRIFNAKNPQSMNTFLVDGKVAGGWRFGDDGRVVLDPFEKLDRATLRELREEADRLEVFAA